MKLTLETNDLLTFEFKICKNQKNWMKLTLETNN